MITSGYSFQLQLFYDSMVIIYNLKNSRIKTLCLLRKERMLADLNNSLAWSFLFRAHNTTVEGIPHNCKEQMPGNQKSPLVILVLYSVLKGSPNFLSFRKPKHPREIYFYMDGWQKGWLS